MLMVCHTFDLHNNSPYSRNGKHFKVPEIINPKSIYTQIICEMSLMMYEFIFTIIFEMNFW